MHHNCNYAVRKVAGCSLPTAAACVGAAFNVVSAEAADVRSLAPSAHPSSLFFLVGSESGWRKSTAYRLAVGAYEEAENGLRRGLPGTAESAP